jgi:hypothetical protein
MQNPAAKCADPCTSNLAGCVLRSGLSHTPVANVKDFREAMDKADLSQGVRLQIKTEGGSRFVFLRLDR